MTQSSTQTRSIKCRTFEYMSDPQHGWIKVKITFLASVFGGSWRSFFTSFSYERGGYVYLEEDKDALTFIKRLDSLNIDYKFRERPAQQLSRIRNYSPLMPRQFNP